MTRDEAIKSFEALKSAPDIIDWYVATGMLKLDEPFQSAAYRTATKAIHGTAFLKAVAPRTIFDALDAVGLKIVEK